MGALLLEGEEADGHLGDRLEGRGVEEGQRVVAGVRRHETRAGHGRQEGGLRPRVGELVRDGPLVVLGAGGQERRQHDEPAGEAHGLAMVKVVDPDFSGPVSITFWLR